MGRKDDDQRFGFVPLASLRKRPAAPASILRAIRQIYFRTTHRTIHEDLERAVELLKQLPTEDEQEKARVFMDGLAQMRSEWVRQAKRRERGGRSTP
jgi:hypothetical protein